MMTERNSNRARLQMGQLTAHLKGRAMRGVLSGLLLWAAPVAAQSGAIVIDHTSIALFDQIPPAYRTAAAAERVLFRTASVGQNISIGLNCLRNNSPNSCRTGFATPASSIPVVMRPQYDRANWLLEFRGNSGWYGKATDFINQVNTRASAFDVMTWKQSYVDDASISSFWTRGRTGPDIGDVELALTARPAVRGVYQTAAIAKVPMAHIRDFNAAMRLYTTQTDSILFDLADIESHRPDGSACLSGSIPVICAEYNSESSGGHLSSGMAKQHVAKAFWVLVARIAGWEP